MRRTTYWAILPCALCLLTLTGVLSAQEIHKHQRGFSEGFAAAGFDKADTIHSCDDCELHLDWGYLDTKGNIVIPPQFAAARDFSNGLAAVQNLRGKWGFINRSGQNVGGFNYDYAYSFSDGLAVVRVGQKYGYVNTQGKFAISLRFTEAHAFHDGLALVRMGGHTSPEFSLDIGLNLTKPIHHEVADNEELGGHRAFIEKDGHARFKVPPGLEPHDSFSENLVPFTITKTDGYLYCGYLDDSGRIAIEPKFGDCEPFAQSKAIILLDGKEYRIDKSGRILPN